MHIICEHGLSAIEQIATAAREQGLECNVVDYENMLNAIQSIGNTSLAIAFLRYDTSAALEEYVVQLQSPDTFVVLVVEHFEHYSDALKQNADGYLLIPFTTRNVIAQIASIITQHQVVNTLLSNRQKPVKSLQHSPRIALREVGRTRFIKLDEISYVRGAGNYIELCLNSGKKILHCALMKDMERDLIATQFVRIHKSVIVRKDLISELRRNRSGSYDVVLDSGEVFQVSRSRKHILEAL
ncbi:LytTR family transcriptional regulator [Aestuariibacter halophilus]|uniref:LytTR family transcriptional regulator n=1 Tax=Fluctibacter halophilus TaxID=226011 RepID=A0ABS8GCJ4_9ALTE|nr:LytTR family DNA-binding domain-containing protein [Aestuariibacter halophilus]MCC2618124.1 LytTR family transcriptional regulator [Aestuariibacter halophilus]